ncbi:hypothetical protein EPUS_02917 [Endocarpon pusillum Z07020]|uniref:Uncharacterized protein n=1 Tax=Endocarpon pusillum (strain Z07020 / HMAS-L-300199) TaxID=1263415 RepID=U1GJY4_ENDPU|nr:uncharacterized protein EPUS_02917 [Endocarpon pusillum Z07020]ERF72126.1 hypothetical protein EPUS_02917 [Endocarpon pusillum Z07020]
MATPIAKLERNNLLLLKVIEAQQSLKSLDAAKTVEEWPPSVGPSPSARMISEHLRAIAKDAVERGLVHPDFKISCSNYYPPKGQKTGRDQRSAPLAKKRARKEADEDDMMHTTDDEVVKTKKTKRGGATKTNDGYPTPPSITRFRSRSTIADVAGATGGLDKKAGNDRNGSDSDSDSDSLADLGDTPTKAGANKQRIQPERRSRAVRKDYTDDWATGELDETDEDFDPYKMRQEQEKQAKRHRARRYADNDDSD